MNSPPAQILPDRSEALGATPGRFRNALPALFTAAAVALGCVRGERAWDASCDAALARVAAGAALEAASAAAGSASGERPFVDWSALRNPILALPDRSLKDQAVAYRDGEFFLFASTRFERGTAAAAIALPSFFRSRDLRRFEPLCDPDLCAPGAAIDSPDLSAAGDLWHLVFQAPPPRRPGRGPPPADARILYVSTSRDLVDWSAASELAPEALDSSLRNLDGALAWHRERAVLGWKRVQSFAIAHAVGPDVTLGFRAAQLADDELRFGPSSLSHSWAENFQFLNVEGSWFLVATARSPGLPFTRHVYTGSHEPYLFQMGGSGDAGADWTRWRCKQQLEIPRESWNRAMHANSATLADWRSHDGHFYLFYAGSADHTSFGGRGHAAIGVARSRDLLHWSVPGHD